MDEITKVLRSHTPECDSAECELCGDHQYWSCSCGWSAGRDSSGYSFITHLLEMLTDARTV
jgi:hypothetical protein